MLDFCFLRLSLRMRLRVCKWSCHPRFYGSSNEWFTYFARGGTRGGLLRSLLFWHPTCKDERHHLICIHDVGRLIHPFAAAVVVSHFCCVPSPWFWLGLHLIHHHSHPSHQHQQQHEDGIRRASVLVPTSLTHSHSFPNWDKDSYSDSPLLFGWLSSTRDLNQIKSKQDKLTQIAKVWVNASVCFTGYACGCVCILWLYVDDVCIWQDVNDGTKSKRTKNDGRSVRWRMSFGLGFLL